MESRPDRKNEKAQGQDVWTIRSVYSDLKQNFVMSGPPTWSISMQFDH